MQILAHTAIPTIAHLVTAPSMSTSERYHQVAEMTEDERRAGRYSDPSLLPLLPNGTRELKGNFRIFGLSACLTVCLSDCCRWSILR